MNDKPERALVPTGEQPVGGNGLAVLLDQQQLTLKAALPDAHMIGRFMVAAKLAARTNSALLKCTAASWVNALMDCAQLGLIPDNRNAALVPYAGKVKLQPMYQGLIDIAYRHGRVKKIIARNVYKGDDFNEQYGTTEEIRHIPKYPRGSEITHTYAIAWLDNGEVQSEVMTADQVEAIKQRALKNKKGDSPWQTDEDEMRRKTVVIRLYKYLPKSAEMVTVMDRDYEAAGFEPGAVIDADAPDRTAQIVAGLKKPTELPAADTEEPQDKAADEAYRQAIINAGKARQPGEEG